MAANIELQNDAGVNITSFNFGAVDGGQSRELKFTAKNTGNQDATSVRLFSQRLAQNDGLDFVALALDNSGSPGTYTAEALDVGTLAAGASVDFWVKVSVPSGTTPAGNPRQFDAYVEYTGT